MDQNTKLWRVFCGNCLYTYEFTDPETMTLHNHMCTLTARN